MLYAAYGSNLHPQRLLQRIATARLVTTAYLAEWSLRFHKRGDDGSGKCSIVAGSSGVHLAIYELSIADKALLDAIEGVGRGYKNAQLQIPSVGRCHSYLADERYVDDAAIPYDWYRALVHAGARCHDFPAAYLAAIEDHPAHEDPDKHRRARSWDIVSACT